MVLKRFFLFSLRLRGSSPTFIFFSCPLLPGDPPEPLFYTSSSSSKWNKQTTTTTFFPSFSWSPIFLPADDTCDDGVRDIFSSFFVAIPSEVLAQLLGRGCLLALFV